MNYDIEHWKSWFVTNSEEHLLNNNFLNAWQDISHAYSPHHHLPKQIRVFYEQLSSNQKQSFRNGLVKALMSIEHKIENLPIFKILLEVAYEVHCNEILDSYFFEKILVRSKIAYFSESNENRSNSQNIYLLSLVLLRRLAGYRSGRKIVSICRDIAQSRLFPPQHKNMLFTILIKARPDSLKRNWNIVRHIYAKDAETNRLKFGELPVFCSEISALVSLNVLATFMRYILSKDSFSPADMWLIRALADEGVIGLKRQVGFNRLFVFYRKEPLLVESIMPSLSALSDSAFVQENLRRRRKLGTSQIDEDPQQVILLYYIIEFDSILIDESQSDKELGSIFSEIYENEEESEELEGLLA